MNITSPSAAGPFRHTVRARLAIASARRCLLIGLALVLMPGAVTQAEPLSPEDAQAMLAAHNAVRAQVGQSALVWSNDMVEVADGWARQLEENPRWCTAVIHSFERPTRTGENMHASPVNSATDTIAPKLIVGAWAAEQQYYTLETNACEDGKVCGHYVQLVWGETKELGCAAAVCHDVPEEGGIRRVTICNYRPGLLLDQRPF